MDFLAVWEGSHKQRILECQSQRDPRNDLILSHFFQEEKLRPTAIIISVGMIPFTIENKWVINPPLLVVN